MKKVLHLFIKKECEHNCPLCCNKNYVIDEIPVVTVELLKSVETVCLTGGEPFLIDPIILSKFVVDLRKQYKNVKNLYIYTSGKDFGENFNRFFEHATWLSSLNMPTTPNVDGINIAPKCIYDWNGFLKGMKSCTYFFFEKTNKSNRLYIFKEQIPAFKAFDIKFSKPMHVDIIYREWDKTFNTPENEYFARLPILM